MPTPPEDDLDLRHAIIDACLEMERKGINQGTSGNISARSGEGMLITPTAMAYATMRPEDIVWMDFDGGVHGDRKPSSEWRFHLDTLAARDDVNAVVHAHPVHCTALAILGRPIPAVHYMIAAAGGPDIPCTPYATYGTRELADHVVAALMDRDACLMAHHGMMAVGGSLERALWLAGEVEVLAQQYCTALQIGDPPVLPDEEIARVVQKFKGYGQGAAED